MLLSSLSVCSFLSNANTGFKSNVWVRYRNQAAMIIFKTASYLTDPITMAHANYKFTWMIDALYPEAYKVSNYGRIAFLYLKTSMLAMTGILPALGAIGLRAIAKKILTEDWTYLKGSAEEKTSFSSETDQEGRAFKSLTHLSWNICCVGAGYPISDGGVMPWSYRIEAIANKVKEQDVDVVCLYEVLDFHSALSLYSRLKDSYIHFYFNIGPRAVGVSSGIFVASRFSIENPEFHLFSKEKLAGRSTFANKGCFGFDVCDTSKRVSILASHFSHSEIPQKSASTTELEEKSLKEEEDSRGYQLKECINMLLNRKRRLHHDLDIPTLLTGDLNDDIEGLSTSLNRIMTGETLKEQEEIKRYWEDLQKGNGYDVEKFGPTWGGDGLRAQIKKEPISEAVNLDHSLILNAQIVTFPVETGYDAWKFTRTALSDHRGLKSTIHFS